MPSASVRSPLLAPFWAFVAFTPLAFVNILQTLSIVIAPFSREMFHRVNIWFAMGIWTWWSVIIERIHGTKLIVSGDELPAGESAVMFANHQSMGDIVVLLCLARRTGRMADMRWMVKGSMKFMPFLGWGMLSLDFLFLKRDWAKDREHIAAAFARFRSRKTPVWLVLFPEGTRRTPEKHAKSMVHAGRAGHPPTEKVMLPRTKGFVASVQGLAGKINAIYRITVGYPRGALSLYELFGGRVGDIHIIVKRHLIATVPSDEPGMSTWLVQEFQEIDRTLRSQT